MTVALRAGTEIANENHSHLPRGTGFDRRTELDRFWPECVSFAFKNHSHLDQLFGGPRALRLSSSATMKKWCGRRSYSSAATMSRKILRIGENKIGAEVQVVVQ